MLTQKESLDAFLSIHEHEIEIMRAARGSVEKIRGQADNARLAFLRIKPTTRG